jgi:hypothetical protein
MTTLCPSDVALEAYLLDPQRSPEAAHVAACPDCAARLAQMREQGEEFRQYVFPRTLDAVERAAERRRFRFRWPFALVPAGALAAAAMAVLLVRTGPPSDYEGVKGSGMALAVYLNGSEGPHAVPDGAPIPASAKLRFKVQPAKECWLWIMSVDERGEISRLYPPKGTSPDRRAAGPVPGGAELDGKPGPERFYAVCAPSQEMAWAEVKAAAAAVAMGGPERVRAARELGGSLSGALQASLLVEKRP